jgi:hypothetical protein
MRLAALGLVHTPLTVSMALGVKRRPPIGPGRLQCELALAPAFGGQVKADPGRLTAQTNLHCYKAHLPIVSARTEGTPHVRAALGLQAPAHTPWKVLILWVGSRRLATDRRAPSPSSGTVTGSAPKGWKGLHQDNMGWLRNQSKQCLGCP